ncbi:MAG: aminotransferase class I/II-fold pyridoxal phosphate-dependent enzyme [Lachnospiraceae bacterium]|nr:aminotransferase class I/II-fold pyridoxal phosphate-dependent enzyme [Lachnospiraceae bacterium]MCI9341393.1 aminotransferase class I/II-fold pyridoxal phosphate-dependent enzyme [Lachnospiraceae bacterium]
MELKFADRMKDFEEGIFQVLNEKKNERLAQGKKVYNLSVGTPDFKPAEHIVDAVVKAAQKPENYKYSLADLPELTQSVVNRFRKRYGVELKPDEIMSVYGSQEGITHIGMTLCNPGDGVLVPNPGYPIFAIGPSLAGARLVPYDLTEENGYLPDLDAMDSEFLKGIKFMVVSYPLNPVCKTAPKSFYEKLVSWAREKNIVIIHDNAYSDIIYDNREGISILSIPGAKDICVEFYSLSKSYNYTGARMSFLVGNKEIVAHFKKLRSQIDYGIFYPVQYGAIAALNGPDDMIREQCAQYQKRRDALCGGLRSIGWNIQDSEGTMFAWGAIPEKYGDDDVAFVMELVEKSGVLCTPGSSFGTLGKGHVRFALTLPVEVIEEAVEAVKNAGVV